MPDFSDEDNQIIENQYNITALNDKYDNENH